MHEIHGIAFLDILEQRAVFLREMQRVPADVRDLQSRGDDVRDGNAVAGNEAEALVQAEFVGHVEQQLHAEADAHQRLAFLRLFDDHLIQSVRAQFGDGVLERAHAGQDDAVRRADLPRVTGDLRLDSAAFQRTLQRKQIAYAVIDDRDHNVPLSIKRPSWKGSPLPAPDRC